MYAHLEIDDLIRMTNDYRDYCMNRLAAIKDVRRETNDYLLEYANEHYADSNEDYEYGDRWLKEKYQEVEDWAQQLGKGLNKEVQKFKNFINELAKLRFDESQAGMLLRIDFGTFTYQFFRHSSASKSHTIFVEIEKPSERYSFNGKSTRSVSFDTIIPRVSPWHE